MTVQSAKAQLLNRLIFSLLFVAVLLAPGIAGVLNTRGAASPDGSVQIPPAPDARLLQMPEYYQAWTNFADTYLSANHTLTRMKGWLDYHLFAMTDAKGVYVGRNGWLFDSRSIDDFRKKGCSQRRHIQRLAQDLDAAARIAEISGRRLLFSVAPDKATIYPEFVGDLPKEPDCGQSLYDLLLVEHKRRPISGFVPLDRRLQQAKNDLRLLYDQTGAYWNDSGAAVAAQELLAQLFPHGAADYTQIDDLSADVLQRRPAKAGNAHQVMQLKPAKQLSAALIYGGPVLARILPYITPRFDRVDLIAGTTIPSSNHHEDPATYETIIVMVTEPQLAELQLDMDGLCGMLGVDKTAARTDIPIEAIRGDKNVSLNIKNNRLLVKSMGAGAYFKLPLLPGSDDRILNVVALEIVAPQNDTLTWTPEEESAAGTRLLHSGLNRLYLPLHRGASATLHINAGRNAGIFEIQDAALLSLGKQPDRFQTGTYAIISPPAFDKPSSCPGSHPARPEVPAETIEPAISLNDFESHRIFQRRGTASEITASGTYQGQAEAIEAQVSRFDTGEVVIPWTIVDGSPSNGVFVGTIPGVPQGGWYRLSVRFGERHAVMAAGRSPWAVGLLAACIGQSNMREWFYAGNDIEPHNLVSVHAGGAWHPTEALGDGAAAFANRLVLYLGVPVGLLDYAANGSGLRREADWGTGYWADRAPGGIYDQFIKGVRAAGGAVEYVIWMQGEADAARKTITETQYRHTLQAFITSQVRHDIVNGSLKANLPFLVVGMPKRSVGQDDPHQAIRNALTAVTHEMDDCYLAAVTLDLKNKGRQHLSPEAYAALGRRTAQTVLYLLGKSEYYRGPGIAQARRAGDDIIDLQLTHRGGNDIEPAKGLTGFVVWGPDGKPVTPTAVERKSPSTIRIHLARPAPVARRVTYLYGAMPDSKAAVHDNSVLKLPLEPFDIEVE